MERCIGRVIYLLSFFFHSSYNHECFLGADIAVVFDFGPDTTDSQIEHVWTFFDRFIEIIEEDPETRVAILSYNNEIRARAYLNDLLRPDVLRQVRDFYSSITDFTPITHHGLLLLQSSIFQESAGDRPDKANLALIISNRQTTDFDVMSARAENLKNSGVIVYVVSIGGNISDAELDSLSSSENHTIQIDFFEDLPENVTKELSDKAFNCMTVVFVARQGGLENVFNAWSSDDTVNEKLEKASDIDSNFTGLYKSDLVQQWDNLDIQKVRVALYSNGQRKSFFVFNGTHSDKMNWFSSDRLIITSETGVVGATTNFFSLEGDAANSRRFFISSRYQGCTGDYGWLVVVDTGSVGCEWSERVSPPFFLYSPAGSAINWRFGKRGEEILTGTLEKIKRHLRL